MPRRDHRDLVPHRRERIEHADIPMPAQPENMGDLLADQKLRDQFPALHARHAPFLPPAPRLTKHLARPASRTASHAPTPPPPRHCARSIRTSRAPPHAPRSPSWPAPVPTACTPRGAGRSGHSGDAAGTFAASQASKDLTRRRPRATKGYGAAGNLALRAGVRSGTARGASMPSPWPFVALGPLGASATPRRPDAGSCRPDLVAPRSCRAPILSRCRERVKMTGIGSR